MENNRAIIAVALIILLWSAYSLFFPSQPIPVQTDAVQHSEKQNEPLDKVVLSDKSSQINDIANRSQSVESVQPDYSQYTEKFISVESDLYTIRLSTSGATVRSITLNQYKQTKRPDAEPYHLLLMNSQHLATFKTSGQK